MITKLLTKCINKLKTIIWGHQYYENISNKSNLPNIITIDKNSKPYIINSTDKIITITIEYDLNIYNNIIKYIENDTDNEKYAYYAVYFYIYNYNLDYNREILVVPFTKMQTILLTNYVDKALDDFLINYTDLEVNYIIIKKIVT